LKFARCSENGYPRKCRVALFFGPPCIYLGILLVLLVTFRSLLCGIPSLAASPNFSSIIFRATMRSCRSMKLSCPSQNFLSVVSMYDREFIRVCLSASSTWVSSAIYRYTVYSTTRPAVQHADIAQPQANTLDLHPRIAHKLLWYSFRVLLYDLSAILTFNHDSP